MSEQEILVGLADIVHDITGIPAANIEPGKSFADDLDIDSLSMVEIVTAAEDRFDVRIPDGDVKDLRTVSDAVAYITKAGVAA